MKTTVRLCAVLLTMLFMTTGCWNMKEIEQMLYAHTIGVDFIDNKYTIYVQVMDFTVLGKQEGGGGKPDASGAWVGKGTGSTFNDAIHDLYAATQRRIYWGHVNTFVFGEKLLANDLKDVLDQITRYNELRYTPWVFATNQSIEEILLSSPVLETSPVYSRISDPLDIYQQSSHIIPTRFNRFISTILEPGKTDMIPNLTLSNNQWKEKKTHPTLMIDGVHVIKGGKWKGRLTNSNVIGLRWMNENTIRAPMVIYDNDKSVASINWKTQKSEITPVLLDDQARFKIKLKVQGTVIQLRENVSESYLKQKAEETIKEEIKRTYKAGLEHKTDIFNLMEPLYRNNNIYWKKMTESKEFPLTENSIQDIFVEVNIVHFGRTIDAPALHD